MTMAKGIGCFLFVLQFLTACIAHNVVFSGAFFCSSTVVAQVK